ncbi:threonine/serine exporter family protein [Liquorilactobacillus nagelii]|uniref:threonine/serine exporter family protein n=1 Tax=Liquorilactobacillus nagelii TaxID=82688 RepID=UPI0039E80D94
MKLDDLIIETILLAGKIMIENGADMARVDDTLTRIARNAGIEQPKIFETTTGILMSIPERKASQVEPILKRTIDLEKVSLVNQNSRAFQAGKISLNELHNNLIKLNISTPFFSFWLQLLAAVGVSCTLMLMYGGHWQGLIATALAGGLGYSCYYFINNHLKVRFVSEFLASFLIGIIAVICVRVNVGEQVNMITVGGVMPLVPGVPITNAVRDVFAGHLLSGMSRALESLLSACAIGMGIAFVFRFM